MPFQPSKSTKINIVHPSEWDSEFVSQITLLSTPSRRNIGQITTLTHIPSIVQTYEDGRLVAVSDASVSDDCFSAHAYAIFSTDEANYLKGTAPVDCDEDDADSTRAEKSGVLAMLKIFGIIESFCSHFSESNSLYCDNKEAVSIDPKRKFLQSYVKFLDSHQDIDAEIVHAIQHLQSKPTLIHLKGHQDDAKDFIYEEDPLSVRLNIDMDEASKYFLKTDQGPLTPTRDTPFYFASKAALKIHDNVISNNFSHHIKLHKNGPKMEQRLINKGILQAQHIAHIQWRGFERAMKRLPTVKKLTPMRIVHNKWSTEGIIAGWYDEHEGICLRCRLQTETQDHVYQCKSQNGRSTYEKAIKDLRKALTKAKTVPLIVEYLVAILKEHRMGYETCLQDTAFYSDETKRLARKVYHKQRSIGPHALSKGLLIKEWESLQMYVRTKTTHRQQTSNGPP